MARTPRMRVAGIVLGAPEARVLAEFYRRLLGWTMVDDQPGWVSLRGPEGGPRLSFQAELDFVRPTWPAAGADDQQMTAHLDIAVDDLAAGEAHALAAGATLATVQPQDDVRVFLDPAGHPFCLFQG
jgi:catechol 2,3-dioxygenase-like lactoylglutathione lyase family enzyme